jgi:hypothetical protein
VRSLNGVPLVAEHVRWSVEGEGGRNGVSGTPGAPFAARRWSFAAVPTAAGRGRLSIANLADEDATVSFVAMREGDVVPLDTTVTVTAQGRASVLLSDLLAGEEASSVALVATADRSVVIEREIAPVGGRWMSHTMGIPSEPVTVPEPSG